MAPALGMTTSAIPTNSLAAGATPTITNPRAPRAWDAPLAAVELPARRREVVRAARPRHVDAAHRPDDAAYDRFVHLARPYRDGGYADDGRRALRQPCPARANERTSSRGAAWPRGASVTQCDGSGGGWRRGGSI
jgi:hypothetical protein